MKKLKHLKTFESFEFESKKVNRKEMIDMLSKDKECKHSKKDLENMSDKELEKMCHKMEGLRDFLTSKISKVVKDFWKKYSDEKKKLKKAEKEAGSELKEIQKDLMEKLKSYRKEITKELDDKSDANTAYKNIKDVITNVKANDKRTTLQKLGAGTKSQTSGK